MKEEQQSYPNPDMRCVLSLLLLWCPYVVIRFALIFPWTPQRLVRVDELEPCDAVVFLDGTYYERLDYAFDLVGNRLTRTSDLVVCPARVY